MNLSKLEWHLYFHHQTLYPAAGSVVPDLAKADYLLSVISRSKFPPMVIPYFSHYDPKD